MIVTAEAARMCGVQPHTFVRWRGLGAGPPWQRVGKKSIRYVRGDVRRWRSAQKSGGENPASLLGDAADKHIEALVEAAPALTPEQIDRLAVLFGNTRQEGAA